MLHDLGAGRSSLCFAWVKYISLVSPRAAESSQRVPAPEEGGLPVVDLIQAPYGLLGGL